jgi:hypothetical protein
MLALALFTCAGRAMKHAPFGMEVSINGTLSCFAAQLDSSILSAAC